MMSSAEVGLYVRMLCYQWVTPEHGLVPDHSALRRLMRWECDGMPEAVMKKFKAGEDGLLRNPRLEAIWKEREAYCASQAANAGKRWEEGRKPPPKIPKPSGQEGPQTDPLELPECLKTQPFTKAWQQWMTYRRGLKKPGNWVDLFRRQLDHLATFKSEHATEAILVSMRNGWTGVFPEKLNGHNSKPIGTATPSDAKF